MQIRRLDSTPDDTQRAVEVMQRFEDRAVAPAWLAQVLADPANYLVVAEVESTLAGFALAYRLQRLDGSAAQMLIYEIEVLEAYRRQGIGTALVQALLAQARAERMIEAFLITNRANTPAVALYQRTGGQIEDGDEVMFVYPLVEPK